MRGFVKNASACLAVAGLVLAQPAMAVRSADSLPSPSAKVMKASRVGSHVAANENIAGVPIFALILALGIAAAVVAVAAGTNKSSG